MEYKLNIGKIKKEIDIVEAFKTELGELVIRLDDEADRIENRMERGKEEGAADLEKDYKKLENAVDEAMELKEEIEKRVYKIEQALPGPG